MPAERMPMRRVREVLRLRTAGVGLNEIARRVGVAPSTIRLTLKRLASARLSWPLPAEMTDSALEAALFAAVGTKQGYRRRTEPEWSEIHRERKRKHVTLAMLWDEYIERHPDGYRYSRFSELYRSWASRLSVTMRQAHLGGDKLFVDYAGDTVPVIVDRLTGQVRAAQIFGSMPRIPPTCAREETLESRGMPCLFLNTERGFGGKNRGSVGILRGQKCLSRQS